MRRSFFFWEPTGLKIGKNSLAKSAVTNSSTSFTRKATMVHISQFSGTYLNTDWTRKFILGSLLQRYDPIIKIEGLGDSERADEGSIQKQRNHDIDVALIRLQKTLADCWGMPVKPLDRLSESRIFRLLARYACGEGLLSDDALQELNVVLERIPGAPRKVENPLNMELLLQYLNYIREGDNLRRIAYPGELFFPPHAQTLAQANIELAEKKQVSTTAVQSEVGLKYEGSDPYDCIRDWVEGPAYAIDSITTSEVDDAIGVHVDPDSKETYFVVYVSDATVYCPFDSQLEQLTARALVNTTYLPEGVFFMLPRSTVEAATLREDRPCRTFNIRFQIDERTGQLKNYSIQVGWLKQLRRVTYDQVQALLEGEQCEKSVGDGNKNDSTESALASLLTKKKTVLPSWFSKEDEARIRKIYSVACTRFEMRMKHASERGHVAIQANLPEPLIKVDSQRCKVLLVEDQIISTQDARLAVAELMIAANQVCSIVAQENGIPIPFRGTKKRSLDHEATLDYCEPQGVEFGDSFTLDPSHTFFAEAMQKSVQQLGSVTRAIYSHVPFYHAGLDTSHYTHSTSPLRRYADMLVHHQLKVWLWQTKRTQGTNKEMQRVPLLLDQLIPEYAMASLCSTISTRQEQSSLLQDSSNRYWLLKYIRDSHFLVANKNGERCCFLALVGDSKRIAASPSYTRFASKACSDFEALSFPSEISKGTGDCRLIKQPDHAFLFASSIYIPRLQLAHTICHSVPGIKVGAVVIVEVTEVLPTQDVLELAIVGIKKGCDERDFERLWKSSVVSSLDN